MYLKRRRRRSSPFLLFYLITFLLIICVLAFIGHSELERPDVKVPIEFDDPEMEPFDPLPFNLHFLPPDNDYSVPDPSIPSNPLPSNSPQLFPLSRLKTGHHSKIYDLVVVNQVGIDEIDPDNGYSLLHYLARSYNLLALKFLLNQNVYGPDGVNKTSDYNSGGDTPLHLAVTHPNLILALFITHLLIDKGADPSIRNAKGLTARDLASQAQVDERILKVIDGEEYDPRIEFKSETKTFLDFAFGSRGPPKDPYFFK
jgi:hypothetical protein